MGPIGKTALACAVIFISNFQKKSDFCTYTESVCGLGPVAGSKKDKNILHTALSPQPLGQIVYLKDSSLARLAWGPLSQDRSSAFPSSPWSAYLILGFCSSLLVLLQFAQPSGNHDLTRLVRLGRPAQICSLKCRHLMVISFWFLYIIFFLRFQKTLFTETYKLLVSACAFLCAFLINTCQHAFIITLFCTYPSDV